MSKHTNVNPDHYKVAGRGRQGAAIGPRVERRELARLRRQERLIHPFAESPERGAEPRSTADDRQPSRSTRTASKPARGRRTGISNRESPAEEARERKQYPPVDTSSPQPQDAAGRVGEEPLADRRDRHTSHKAGSRSIAQKQAGARYPDRSAPAARKVAGAFGREPQRASSNDAASVRRARPKRAAKGKRSR